MAPRHKCDPAQEKSCQGCKPRKHLIRSGLIFATICLRIIPLQYNRNRGTAFDDHPEALSIEKAVSFQSGGMITIGFLTVKEYAVGSRTDYPPQVYEFGDLATT